VLRELPWETIEAALADLVMVLEQKHGPVQLYYLFKSFFMMFTIQALIVLFLPVGLTVSIRYQILAMNAVVGAVLGWYLYKQWYHINFSYDELGFELRKGKYPPVAHGWKEFSQVSLVRDDRGDFTIRLHKNESPVEIPASKLKLDPFRFKLEVMNLVTKPGS
jgi:hypothetical protein